MTRLQRRTMTATMNLCLTLVMLFSLLSCIGTSKTHAFLSPVLPTDKRQRSTLSILPNTFVIETSARRMRRRINSHDTGLEAMKRPILDRIATTLFNLEQSRVNASLVIDSKGRVGEPMEWSDSTSLANQFSNIIATNEWGYRFKQFIADITAEQDYDREAAQQLIDDFVTRNKIAMFSFTTCPFCRRAKDYFDERSIPYTAMELDELEGNRGNVIRAQLGRFTKRTSVPCIFINGQCIGGCNDGPGLLPLAESGKLDEMLAGI